MHWLEPADDGDFAALLEEIFKSRHAAELFEELVHVAEFAEVLYGQPVEAEEMLARPLMEDFI
jgi:hypothetical protein